MADHADDGDDIFIYRGGRAPRHVTHVRIDKSVEVIDERAFFNCEHLVNVETHDGIRRVGDMAFYNCKLFRRINLKSVVEIGKAAFYGCNKLTEVECGDKLETIGRYACYECSSLKHLKLPSIITIKTLAFWNCRALTDIEFSERLDKIETNAFVKSITIAALVNNIFNKEYISNGYYYTFDDTWTNPGVTTTIEGAGFYPQATRNFLIGATLKF